MTFPVQVAAVLRDGLTEPYIQSMPERCLGLGPSCDPNTQVTCGSGCCNASLEYCLGNRCHPYV